MNLLIDCGNTFTKVAVFENNKKIDYFRYDQFGVNEIVVLKSKFSGLRSCIISCVRSPQIRVLNFLRKNFSHLIDLGPDTDIPFENHYLSGQSLGSDRIALVAGANNMFPGNNVLVIDAGTAITFDFVNDKNQYEGGNISPGLSMRFRALNKFTGRLPLLDKSDNFQLFSDSTDKAIVSGVQKSIIFEIEGYVNEFHEKFKDLKVILTGGDSFFLENKLKVATFVIPDLIFAGLNTILEYNGIN